MGPWLKAQDKSGSSFVQKAKEKLKDDGSISKGHKKWLEMVYSGQIYYKYI